MCTQRQPFWVLCSWFGTLLFLIHDVNWKLLQAEGWSSRYWRSTLPMQAIALQTRWWRRLWSWTKALVASDAASPSVLFHSARSLEWCCFSVDKQFSFTIHFYEIVLTQKIVTWKFATRKFTDLQYFNSSNQTSSIVTQHMAMFINSCCSKRHGLLWVKAHHYLKLNNMVVLSNRNSLSFRCRNIFVQIKCQILHEYNFTPKFSHVGWLPATHKHFPNCCCPYYPCILGSL